MRRYPQRRWRVIVNLVSRIIPEKILKKYEFLLYSAGIKFLASEYLTISILSSFGVSIAMYILTKNPLYTLIGVVAVLTFLLIIYPNWKISKRVAEMEQMLPDAFFYLASILRAGVSFPEALEDITETKLGALTEEFRRTVEEMRKGKSTIEALRAFALRNKRSPIIYRSMMIIIESMERGAPMADVLVSVANDVREILRIKRERKASTGMQAMFFIASSGFVGPLIIGMVSQLAAGLSGPQTGIELPVDELKTVLMLFVIIQAIISGIGIGVIREGNYSSGVKYSVLLAIMAGIIFSIASRLKLI